MTDENRKKQEIKDEIMTELNSENEDEEES